MQPTTNNSKDNFEELGLLSQFEKKDSVLNSIISDSGLADKKKETLSEIDLAALGMHSNRLLRKKESSFDKLSKNKANSGGAALFGAELNLGMSNQDIELDLDEIDRVIRLKTDALKLYRKKNFLESLSKLEEAIKVIPGDLDLIFYEGMCLFQMGNVRRAHTIFSKLVDLDKNRSIALLPKMFSMSLLRLEKFADAEKFLKEILSTFSYDTQLQNMLGYALERQNKLLQAEETYQQILEEHPDDPNAANSLAYIYYRLNKFLDKALSLVKKALDKEPDNPAYLDTFAMVLHKRGNTDAARKALKKALEKAPKNAEILAHVNQLFGL